MKKNLLIPVSIFIYQLAASQNVGIGTNSPNAAALLHVDIGSSITKGLLISGISDYSSSTVPDLGPGSRMMFYPGKAAFRAGSITGTQWNNQNIGFNSTAMGYSNTASGEVSTAMGDRTTASGYYSTAMGSITIASGYSSTAMGFITTASGSFSTAIGHVTKAKGYASTVIGMYNDSILTSNETSVSSTTPLFIVGNGNNVDDRSNAMVVQKNGNVGIGNSLPNADALLHVNTVSSTTKGFLVSGLYNSSSTVPDLGAGSRMMFYPGKAAFRAGYITGTQWNNENAGRYSAAIGYNTIASNNSTMAFGESTVASGFASTAIGLDTRAKGYASTVVGILNDPILFTDENSITPTTPLFIIGNGDANTRSNALVVQKNGNIGLGTSTPGFLLSFANSLGDKISLWGSSGNHYGLGIQPSLLQIHTDGSGSDIAFGYGQSGSFTETMRIKGNGNVGIGIASPVAKLDVNGNASFNNYTILLRAGSDPNHGLRYDAGVDGPYLFGYNGGALGTIDLPHSLTWDFNGNASIYSNLTVQNGKGIIRSADGTQQKKLVKIINVSGNFTAYQTRSFAFNWPETFGAAPDAYVGAIASGSISGWAEMVMSVVADNTTGGILYVHNPLSAAVAPNYNVKIIAIGPQ